MQLPVGPPILVEKLDMNSRVTMFADETAAMYVASVPADEARRLIATGQAAPIGKKVKNGRISGKIRAIYLTGEGECPASPMSRAIRTPIYSERLGGTVGVAFSMRLRTYSETIYT